jgi:predicted metal-dependent hydrolase
MTVKQIFRLEMFRGEKASRNWAIVAGVLVYMMVSIWLSHISELTAKDRAKINAENRRLRSEYVGLKSMLMQRQLRSGVYNDLKDDGFIIPKRQPVKIVEE